MTKINFIVLFVIIGLFGFSACVQDRGFFFDEETFTTNWNAWENKNIKNYSFTMTGKLPYWDFSRAIPLYEYTVNIIVKNGMMNSFEYIGDAPRKEDGTSILEPEFTSISNMYEDISQRAQAEKEWWDKNTGGGIFSSKFNIKNNEWWKGWWKNNTEGGIISTKFDVKYNEQLHYITFFEPVSEWESGWIVDTTAHAVTISNFVVLDNK